MNEDSFERGIRERVQADFGPNARIVYVSNSYIRKLQIIQSHLKTLYGDKADWQKGLERYKNSTEYKSACHVVKSIDDLPELTFDDIQNMISEEKAYKAASDKVLQDEAIISDISGSVDNITYINALLEAEGLLGILPIKVHGALQHWLIDYDAFTENEIRDSLDKMNKRETCGLLPMVIKQFSDDFIAGMLNRYAGAGEVMQQRRTKYYFRGENAYYGKSQPSAFRHRSDRPYNKIPLYVQNYIEDLRAEEASEFFLKFDAVKYWGYCQPVYRALCQHYGLWTSLLDITSDIKTALFFACCKWEDNRWKPLTQADFEKKVSRKYISDKGGDSRYGILYRSPSEITTMVYGNKPLDDEFEIITPVGWQPFMRCAAQSAYIKCSKDPAYDAYKDELFEKYKFRLTEDICNWIYEEMDQGDKIYPRNDVPDITGVMSEINKTHVFSQKTFDKFCGYIKANPADKESIKMVLQCYGYSITPAGKSYVSYKQMRKWNKQYPLEKVEAMIDEEPKSRPMMVLTATE